VDPGTGKTFSLTVNQRKKQNEIPDVTWIKQFVTHGMSHENMDVTYYKTKIKKLLHSIGNKILEPNASF
jgi:hypothetical protein